MYYLQIVFIITVCINFKTEAYRIFKVNGEQKLFAHYDERVRIVCENEMPLAHCGFTHPNHTKIIFSDLIPGTPQCEVIIDISSDDAGMWTCHIWPQSYPQEEIKKVIHVKIANKFAAISRKMVVNSGDQVTLSCATTISMEPLNHCYFTTPDGRKLNMADELTSEIAILDQYYFPINKSLHRGDCSVTIKKASTLDYGIWFCNAWIEYEHGEFRDFIFLNVKGEAQTEGRIEDGDSVVLATYDGNITAVDVAVYTSLAFLVLIIVILIIIKFYWNMRSIKKLYKHTDTRSIENGWAEDNVNLVTKINNL